MVCIPDDDDETTSIRVFPVLHSDQPRPPGMARRWARRIERYCCTCVTYLPLVIIYGVTSWAVFVLVNIGVSRTRVPWLGRTTALIGVALYGLLNWCYTTAVLTRPGSTTDKDGYTSILPHAQETPAATSFTVKSNGETRFCKKCQARKPDRAHHCSTCRRCVLKMDHHCPWLATCIGLRNHKAFLLFLIYTSVFSLYSFVVSGSWVYAEMVNATQFVDSRWPLNYIMLCVVGGIFGLTVGVFTAWHVYLACRGQTTIECLKKTRYLSPLRRTLQQAYDAQHTPGRGILPFKLGQQLLDMRQSVLPTVIRPEEGEELRHLDSPYTGTASTSDLESGRANTELQVGSRHFTCNEMERYRARRRYEDYLDEQDSIQLPHAFDLGWRRNLRHLFGPKPLLWPLPVCNTTGDGWVWEPSPAFVRARERLARERFQQTGRERAAGWGLDDLEPSQPSPYHLLDANTPACNPRRTPCKADKVLGRDSTLCVDGAQAQQQPPQSMPIKRSSLAASAYDDTSGDEDDDDDKHVDSDASGSRTQSKHNAIGVATNGRWGRGATASGLLSNRSGPGSSLSSPAGRLSSNGGGSGGVALLSANAPGRRARLADDGDVD